MWVNSISSQHYAQKRLAAVLWIPRRDLDKSMFHPKNPWVFLPKKATRADISYTRWWFQTFLIFGKIPNLTNIFQRGWNHHLVYHLFLRTYLDPSLRFSHVFYGQYMASFVAISDKGKFQAMLSLRLIWSPTKIFVVWSSRNYWNLWGTTYGGLSWFLMLEFTIWDPGMLRKTFGVPLRKWFPIWLRL